MRFNDFAFESILNETGLKWNGLHTKYVQNIINLVNAKKPLTLTSSGAATIGAPAIQLRSTESERLSRILAQADGRLNSKKYLDLPNDIKYVYTTDKKYPQIPLSWLDKTPDIKGKEEGLDYNIGDIGEISLAIAVAAKFIKLGEDSNVIEFVNLAKQFIKSNRMNAKGKVLDSLKLDYSGTIKHKTGKEDIVKVIIVAPGRSVTSFVNLMATIESNQSFPQDVKGTILSAIQYAHNNAKIKHGIEVTAKDPNQNTIEVICDGQSDQKGTKADLLMDIDGKRINLLSVKTGPSQLGQATGHDWKKHQNFFKVVFSEDVSEFASEWGTSNEEHMAALRKCWDKVTPRVLRLAGGDSVQKEITLIQSFGQGLIRYANNYDEKSGKSDPIDIVKLIVDPGTPGYSLMKIDQILAKKLETTDLHARITAGGMGVIVFGQVEGKEHVLFKARTVHSKAGNTVRTLIEGGSFLDELATVPIKNLPRKKAVPVARPTPTVAPAPVAPTPTPAPVAPTVVAPATTTTPAVAPVDNKEKVEMEDMEDKDLVRIKHLSGMLSQLSKNI